MKNLFETVKEADVFLTEGLMKPENGMAVAIGSSAALGYLATSDNPILAKAGFIGLVTSTVTRYSVKIGSYYINRFIERRSNHEEFS